MKLLPLLDDALIRIEKRTAYYSRTPRVWPSEASATLFDTTESGTVGKCHRASYWRMIGEPITNPSDKVGLLKMRTGRAMELEIVNLAKEAGIFVANGVRYHVEDVNLPLELDLIVIDPVTKQLVIVENKTISGYYSNTKVIKKGDPKLEGVMQATLYLNEFSTGEILKAVIRAGFERKLLLENQLREMKEQSLENTREFEQAKKDYDRNRIEVDLDNLEEASDGPVAVKMTYETRDDCQSREFDIAIHENEIDGLHYPAIDGTPQKLFTIENIYERFGVLQGYFNRNVLHVQKELAKKGVVEPPPGKYTDVKLYFDKVFEAVRALPRSFWPPAEYEWRYKPEKITRLGEMKILGKTKYAAFKKKKPGSAHIGAWQCAFCGHRNKCVSVEYPEMQHMIFDVMNALNEDEEEEAA